MNRGIGAIVSLLAVVLLGGCITTSQRLEVTPRLEAAPAATKRPQHAGIYYSHDFLMQEHRRALGSHSAIAPIELFNKTGVQAIEVTVRSDAPAPWVVRASDMRLLLGSDYAAEPAAVSSVLTRMESAAPPGAGTVLLGLEIPVSGLQ